MNAIVSLSSGTYGRDAWPEAVQQRPAGRRGVSGGSGAGLRDESSKGGGVEDNQS